MKYRIARPARADMREIANYIRTEQKSPQNAGLVLKRLSEKFKELLELPQLGHIREELQDDQALVTPISGLLVIYDPFLKPLTILRVIHASRDLSRIKTRPKS